MLELPGNIQSDACKRAVGALSLMQNVFVGTVAINLLSLSGRQKPGEWGLGKT